MAESRFSLPETLINTTLAYLGKRPFEEVAALIAALQQQAEKLEEPAADAPAQQTAPAA